MVLRLYWWGLKLVDQGVAWLRPPTYIRSIFISLQYYVWVCGIFAGFSGQNFCRSNQRTEGVAENNVVEVVRLSFSQTLAIGYGQSRVALGRSNSFKTPTDTRLK